jgi:superfamily I DNA/RNA helicase
VFNTEDITVLFAGAGAGKTTHLIRCVEEDLKHYRPEDVAFVSYTRKGAYEGKDRLVRKLNLDADRLVFFRTLHSLTFSELGYKREDMFTLRHAKEFNSLLGFNLTTNPYVDSNTPDDKLLAIYEQKRAGRHDIYTDLDGYDRPRYLRMINAYQEYKKQRGLYDYTDCLENFVKRGKSVPVEIAYIDEAQDLTTLQWNVCTIAFAKAKKIYVAGDDYQSIYKYAGARPDVLIDLAAKHKTVKLEVSYRLPRKVYDFARSITDAIGVKVEKDYRPFKEDDGMVEFVNDRRYMAHVIASKQDESWLVLFRNNYNAAVFEMQMQAELIPYHTPQGFVVGEKLMMLLKKYYNFRKEGYKGLAEKKRFAKMYDIQDFNLDFTESNLIPGDQGLVIQAYIEKFGLQTLSDMAKATPKVFVSTIHRVKGSEARNVAVFMDCSFKVYRNRYRDMDSELRLLYVAFTRAKENLYIVKSESKYGMDDVITTLKEHNGL